MDTYLFRKGAPADALFILRSGSVRVIQQRPYGGAMVVMHVAAGAVVEEKGVLDSTSRVASVITNTPSIFLKLHRSAFQSLAVEAPVLRSRVEALASGRIWPHPEP
jgi:CRP-like cAMP-binding protein